MTIQQNEEHKDTELRTVCPYLLEENKKRMEEWASFSPPISFNYKKESVVEKEYCKSFSFGTGCRKLKECWKE